MTANGSGDPFAVDNPYALDALTFAWGDEYDEIWVHGGEWCAHHKDGHDEKPPAPSLSRVNAGELRSGGGVQGPSPACRGFVLVIGDDGGQRGDPQVGGWFAGRVLVPAAERGFDFACADAGAARAVQAGQDGAADLSGQVRGGGEDAAGAGDRELGGFDGDLVAGPVGVGA